MNPRNVLVFKVPVRLPEREALQRREIPAALSHGERSGCLVGVHGGCGRSKGRGPMLSVGHCPHGTQQPATGQSAPAGHTHPRPPPRGDTSWPWATQWTQAGERQESPGEGARRPSQRRAPRESVRQREGPIGAGCCHQLSGVFK